MQAHVIEKIINISINRGLSSRQTAHMLAITRAESEFNPDAAAGTTSAYGLGQFVKDTGKDYGIHTQIR